MTIMDERLGSVEMSVTDTIIILRVKVIGTLQIEHFECHSKLKIYGKQLRLSIRSGSTPFLLTTSVLVSPFFAELILHIGGLMFFV